MADLIHLIRLLANYIYDSEAMMALKYISDIGREWGSSLEQSAKDPFTRTVPLVLAVTTASLGAWYVWKRWSNRNRKLPPCPPGWPLLGNMLELSEENMHLDVLRIQKQYNLPDIFTLRLGPSNAMVVLNSHDALKDAFGTQGDMFAERPPSACLDAMQIKDEIFMKPYTDPSWGEGKRFILSALRGSGLGDSKSSEDKILEQVDIFMASMETKVKNNESIDMNDVMKKTAANIIFGLLFSKVYDLEDPELLHRTQMVENWYAALYTGYFLDFFNPWIAKVFFRRTIRHVFNATEDCRAFVRQEIKEHMDTLDPDHPRDFVDICLTKKGGQMSLESMANTIFFVLPDSIGTTGCFISWVLFYVTHHPEVMRRIQAEIDDVTSGNRHVKWSDRPRLPFTEATIKEAIRHSSPMVATGFHTPIKDCYYRGHYFPAGIPIIGNLYAALQDPNFFKDPERFDPERFLDSDGALLQPDTWITFGIGRRKCMGENIAKMQMFLFVANLFQRYDFKFSDDNPNPSLEPVRSLDIRMPQPYKVVLTRKM